MKVVPSFIAIVAILAFLGTAIADFSIRCGGGVENAPGGCATLSLDDDTLNALVVFATGGSDCPAINAHNYPTPSWGNLLFDVGFEGSVSQFYYDNSRGSLLLNATVANRGDDSCFFSRHIPCNFPFVNQACLDSPAHCMLCDSCPLNCDSCDTLQFGPRYNPCACEWDSFFVDIMSQVDALYDLSEFDLTGSNGVPDGHLDLLIFISYGPYGADAGLGHLNRSTYTSSEDEITIGQTDGCIIWDFTDWYNSVSLIAHEVGHTWVAGTQFDKGGWSYHLGDGAFDVMGRGGFWDSTLTITHPSLHNPLARGAGGLWLHGQNWITTHDAHESLFDVTLEPSCDPNLPYSEQGDCYRMKSPLDTNQWFVIAAHNRTSLWERYWPARGLTVWRINQNENLPNDKNIKLEIESSSGYWQWTVVDNFEGSNVAVRTEVRDAVTGSDSMDFIYTLRDGNVSPMFSSTVGYQGAGGPTSLFGVGSSMDDLTNPSFKLRTNDSAQFYPRLRSTGFALRNIRESAQHEFTADLIVNSWQGVMTQSHTWFDSIYVSGNVSVGSTATLTVNAGTHVYVSPNASLTINGRINIQGTSQNPVIFACSNPDSTWSGIKVLSDDTLNMMKHVVVRDVKSVGVLVHQGYLRMEDCEIDGMDGQQFGTDYGVAYVYSDGYVLNCEIHSCERIGLFVVDNRVICEGNEITENGQGGVRFVRGDHKLGGNDISSNGWEMDTLRQPWAGAEIFGASVEIKCNEIEWNSGPGIFAFAGGYGSMSAQKWNHIHDNMGGAGTAGYDYGQVHMRGGHVSLGSGLNSIYDDRDSRWLVRNSMPDSVSLDMTRNYWGTIDSATIASRLPEFAGFQPFYSEVLACGTIPPDTTELDVETDMFHRAWDMEHQGLFEAAILRYDSLINYYKSEKYSKPSLERLAVCNKAAGLTWSEVRDYFFELAEDSSKDESLVMQCKISAAWCLANMEDFIGCANELQALLDTAETETEIVSIQIDLLLNELKQNFTDGLFGAPGQRGLESDGLDAAEQSDDMVAQKVTRFANALDEVISGRANLHRDSQDNAPPVPTRFALHQNYPNPFNPTTEFSFDLPEGSIVELKVFDILGREVATVVDKYFEAGTHHINWDSRSTGTALASGVYIYQIKAGGFTDAKKMILLR